MPKDLGPGARNIVLSLCDYSGIWSQPYRENGYKVVQVDIKLGLDVTLWPSSIAENESRTRYSREFADIRPYIGKVHAVLAAPVCTVFSGAGAKHPRTDAEMRHGLALVDACYRIAYVTRAPVFALENPVGKLPLWCGDPLLRFNPCDYAGHADHPETEAYTKRTCLYGHFNTALPLAYREPVLGSKMWSDYGGKSERTKEMRSMTPQGFSRAFFLANSRNRDNSE
jgi:hypothetical protein